MIVVLKAKKQAAEMKKNAIDIEMMDDSTSVFTRTIIQSKRLFYRPAS